MLDRETTDPSGPVVRPMEIGAPGARPEDALVPRVGW
jgi:hypothetical protein